MLNINDSPAQPLIAASIHSADYGRHPDERRDVLDSGADRLHVDVMDGHFVPNLTMGRDVIQGLRRHLPDTFLDVHLMVERPQEYIDDFAKAGANLFTFHVEVCRPARPDGPDAGDLIRRIRKTGMAAGMAVNPPTGVEGLEAHLADLDLALVMSVNPGFSGQKFMAEVLAKVDRLHGRRAPKTRIEMDGGLNPTTSADAIAAGTDVLVTASALFGADDRAAVIRAIRGYPPNPPL